MSNTVYGTYYQWFFMARHNKNRGMNFLYFDGHVEFNPDLSVNPDYYLDSMRWGSY